MPSNMTNSSNVDLKNTLSEEMIALVEEVVLSDARLKAKEIAVRVNLDEATVIEILHEYFQIFRINTKWISVKITSVHRKKRLNYATEFLQLHKRKSEVLLDSIVTGDETMALYYYPLPMKRRHGPGEFFLEKTKVYPSVRKIMITIFWDRNGVLLIDFKKCNTMVSAEHYAKLLKQLRKAIEEKRPGMLVKDVRLLHNDSPVHSSSVVKTTIQNCEFIEMKYPDRSPDLNPNDYYLFPQLKYNFHARHFKSGKTVERAVLKYLDNKDNQFFSDGINTLLSRCKKCIAEKGYYNY